MRSHFKLYALCLVTTTVAVVGCGPSPLSEPTMERQVLVADLLEVQSAKGGTQASRFEGEWPEGSVLDLKGRIRNRSKGAGTAVTFSVAVDGREIFSRRMKIERKSANFKKRIALEAVAEPTEVSLRIDAEDTNVSFGRWVRAAIHTETPTPRAPSSEGPNLLFVVVDTLRADHCSLYGYPRSTTPALEELAATSLVFEQAVSQCSWTAPAVASMLTGLYPLQHGVIRGEVLGHRFATLGESLQAAGVTTFAVSTNPLIDEDAGYAQGFETFHHLRWERADVVNEKFLEWLPEVDGQRWFAYLHYTDPHSPYDAPGPDGEAFVDPAYDGPFDDLATIRRVRKEVNFEGGTDERIGDADLDHLRGLYDGEIRFWDRHFGELIADLRARDLLDRTVVIVTSDHGEEFLEHGKFAHGHHLYEESVRVPLLIRAPRLAPGRRSEPVETRALQRAALALMGVDIGELRPGDLFLDGSLLPAFSHTVHKTSAELRRQSVVAAVRDQDWKLVYWPLLDQLELFDLGADAGEEADIAAENRELVERYRGLLDTWLETGPIDAVTDEAPELDPELLDELRALGYVP